MYYIITLDLECILILLVELSSWAHCNKQSNSKHCMAWNWLCSRAFLLVLYTLSGNLGKCFQIKNIDSGPVDILQTEGLHSVHSGKCSYLPEFLSICPYEFLSNINIQWKDFCKSLTYRWYLLPPNELMKVLVIAKLAFKLP